MRIDDLAILEKRPWVDTAPPEASTGGCAPSDTAEAEALFGRVHAGMPRLPLGQRSVADRYEAGLTALPARGLYDEAAIFVVSRSIIESWFR